MAEAESSFEKDAPDAGAVAPAIEATTLDGKPLTLEQFKGKFVLLDFWATWCGPCIEEIPTLQAVHEEFGKDERFAMVSLSVDEKIDEPRKFQSKRQLPWTQGFLGGGIHGPTPGRFGVRAIPAFVLVGPDGKIVARGMRGEAIKKSVAEAMSEVTGGSGLGIANDPVGELRRESFGRGLDRSGVSVVVSRDAVEGD